MGIDNLSIDLANGFNDVAFSSATANSELIFALRSLESASNLSLSVSLDAKDLVALEQANFAFNPNDHVNFDVSAQAAMSAAIDTDTSSHSSGTHLASSLSDLQKLGVDTVSGLEALGNKVQIDLGSGFNAALALPKFADAADITLKLDSASQLTQIDDLAKALFEAGIDHISLGMNQGMTDAEHNALKALTSAGLDFNLVNTSAYAMNSLDSSLAGIVNHGIAFGPDQSMGSLLEALSESGLARIDLTQPAAANHLVSITDDLASALYEAGMLHALPEAGIEITAGMATTMHTSFKAMAELGVDKVASDLASNGLLHVNLGTTVDDLASLLQSFVVQDNNVPTQKVFDHAAELDVGALAGTATTVQTLQTLLQSGLGSQLHDLGITKVVAQVASPAVTTLGVTQDHGNMVFDLDILSKKH